MRTVLLNVLLVAAGFLGRANQELGPIAPRLISGNLPLYVEEHRLVGVEGEARISVTTDGSRVALARIVSDRNHFGLEAWRAIRSWRFEQHTPGSFDVDVQFRIRRGCRASSNSTVRLWLPNRIEVTAYSGANNWCEDARTPEYLTAKAFVGTLNCACPDRGAVAGAQITLVAANNSKVGQTVSQTDGRFALPSVPPGVYHVRIERADYVVRLFTVELKSGSPESLEVQLKPVEPIVQEATMPLLPFELTSPVDAVVSFDSQGEASLKSVPSTAGSAALANARTWRIGRPLHSSGFEVRYNFLPLRECGNLPDVDVVLPSAVTVGSCRH